MKHPRNYWIKFHYESEGYEYENLSSSLSVYGTSTSTVSSPAGFLLPRQLIGNYSIMGGGSSGRNVLVDNQGNGASIHYITVKTSKRLSRITTSSGFTELVFGANTVRTDLNNTSYYPIILGAAPKRLDFVDIKTSAGAAYTKRFALNYDYLTDPNCSADKAYAKRLRLLSVQEMASNAPANALPPYVFEYQGNNEYPNRLSKAVDHWGFYNGKLLNNRNERNTPAIPNYCGTDITASDRASDEISMKKGVLNKITYPTGGTTTFALEANKAKGKDSSRVVLASLISCSGPSVSDCCGNITRSSSSLALNSADISSGAIRVRLTVQKPQSGSCTTASDFFAGLKVFNVSTGIQLGAGVQFALFRSEQANTKCVDLALNELLFNSFADLGGAYRFELNTVHAFGTVEVYKLQYFEANKIVGGLRVQQITTYDGLNIAQNMVTNYDYSQPGTSLSSGVLTIEPNYISKMSFNALNNVANFNLISDVSVVPLSDFAGYHVSYGRVTEIKAGLGRTVYELFQEEPVGINSRFREYPYGPTPPTVKAGMTQATTQLSENGTTVSRLTQDNVTVGYELVGSAFKLVRVSASANFYFARSYDLIKPKFVRMLQKTEMKDGVTSVTTQEFAHAELSLPTKISTTNSDNATTILEYKYPHDCGIQSSNVNGSNPCNWMLIHNLLTPIEITRKVNGVVVEGSKIAFSITLFSNAQALLNAYTPMPWKSYQWIGGSSPGWQQTGEIMEYWSNGAMKRFRANGSTVDMEYTWNKGVVTQKKFGTLVSNFQYINNNSQLLESIIDENGLKTKYYYDGLQRLVKTENRMKDDGSDVQATTEYTYVYKNASNRSNVMRTRSTFANVALPSITESYLDGLGRPVGGMKQSYTPNRLHLKSVVTYDALGRQDKTYLPFESALIGYEDAPFGTPWMQTAYEASPLSRPTSQRNVDGTVISTSYGANISNEVRIFANNGYGSNTSTGYYAANQLFKTTITDENGKQTVVFKDKLGRVLLTRKFLNGQNVDTYNVYDAYRQLVAVLPPGSETNGLVNAELIFQYSYDLKNRLMTKKIPGSAIQKFYYDSRDLLVLTQDGNMAAASPSKHLATLYDNLGRVVKTGFAMVNPTQGVDFVLSDAQITDRLTETQYYPNKSWVQHQGAKVLKPAGTVTPTDFVWSYVERRAALNYTGNPAWTGKQHLMHAGVAQRPIVDADVAGVDWSITGLNGAGQPTMAIRYLFAGAGASDVRTWQNFTYDNGNRLTDQQYSYALHGASLTAPTFTLANMVYNGKDQLVEKNIGYQVVNGVNKALQSIDYQYNVRGWLTNINQLSVSGGTAQILTPSLLGTGAITRLAIAPYLNDALTQGVEAEQGQTLLMPPVADNNADLFSQSLTYNSPDSRTGAVAQSNGNISSTIWQVAGRSKQAYGFAYDDLNRLTDATYFDIAETTNSATFSTDNKFREKLTYDVRGNITTLQRNGMNSGGWTSNQFVAGTYGLIDNLTYVYGLGNQLKQVNEASLPTKGFKTNPNATGDQYGYDANGNLIYDKNKYITSIEYNYLNLPIRIVIQKPNDALNSGTIEFVYDATGVKLRKTVKRSTGVVKETWDYVNGVEYKDRLLQRVAHGEGAIVWNDQGVYEQEYVLRDHLGNTRVTFTDSNNDGIVTSADVKQLNHYYPFGLNMEGNWNGAQGTNKYQYNGKELNDDFGLGWNDYGARFYDPSIARWSAIDPLAEARKMLSGYQYVQNNPARLIDPTGMIDAESFYGGGATGKTMAEKANDFQEKAIAGNANKSSNNQDKPLTVALFHNSSMATNSKPSKVVQGNSKIAGKFAFGMTDKIQEQILEMVVKSKLDMSPSSVDAFIEYVLNHARTFDFKSDDGNVGHISGIEAYYLPYNPTGTLPWTYDKHPSLIKSYNISENSIFSKDKVISALNIRNPMSVNAVSLGIERSHSGVISGNGYRIAFLINITAGLEQ